MTQLDIGALTLILGVLIPIVTGIVTKVSAHSGLKAVVTLTLAAATTAAEYAVSVNGVVNLKDFFATAVLTWIISIVAYYGLLKPAGVTRAVQAVTATYGLPFGTSDPDDYSVGTG